MNDDFPLLDGVESQLQLLREEYREPYQRYVKQVSDAEVAISLEQVGLLVFLMRQLPVKRVLDTGSGFSSYVLRREALKKDGVIHYAVDDNASWLQKTRDFLRMSGLSDERVLSLQEFQADSTIADFDLIYHDVGDIPTRIRTLPTIAERVNSAGWLILDDMHKERYRGPAIQCLGERWLMQSLIGLTNDRWDRYAFVCRRKQ